MAVVDEAYVTLYTDWGEPPVSCRARGLAGWLAGSLRRVYLWLPPKAEMPGTGHWAFGVGYIDVV